MSTRTTVGHSIPSILGFYSIVWLCDGTRKRTNSFSFPSWEMFTSSSASKFRLHLPLFAVSMISSRHENCLVNRGTLLEYFLLELIQIEHADIRQRLASKSAVENTASASEDDSSEQKSRLSKVIDEIEQCIYCLYGLVLRKSKMKYLNDHHCSSVSAVSRLTEMIVFFFAVGIDSRQSEHRVLRFTTETVAWVRRPPLNHHQRSNDRSVEVEMRVVLTAIADGKSLSTLRSDDRMERWTRTTTNTAPLSHCRCRIDWQRRETEWSIETTLRSTLSISSCVSVLPSATLDLLVVLVSTKKICITCSPIIIWKWLRKM